MTEPEIVHSPFPSYRRESGNGGFEGLPTVRWSLARGWLNVRDPVDGTWFSIPAKGAPYGWVRLANQAKESHL
jgi:hypothetical protein